MQQQQYQPAQAAQQPAYNSSAALNESDNHQTSPSLLDKAKAYIPVLGSSTEFDPAAEARAGQQERLFQDVPQGYSGYEPEDSPHEGFLDKARAYMPTMGAPGTTTAGIDVRPHARLVVAALNSMLHMCLICPVDSRLSCLIWCCIQAVHC